MRPLKISASRRLAFSRHIKKSKLSRSNSAAACAYNLLFETSLSSRLYGPEPSRQKQNVALAENYARTRPTLQALHETFRFVRITTKPHHLDWTDIPRGGTIPRPLYSTDPESIIGRIQWEGKPTKFVKLADWVDEDSVGSKQVLNDAILPLVRQWMSTATTEVPSPTDIVDILIQFNLLQVYDLHKIISTMLHELINGDTVRHRRVCRTIEHQILVLWHYSLSHHQATDSGTGEFTPRGIDRLAQITWPIADWQEAALIAGDGPEMVNSPHWRLRKIFPKVPVTDLNYHITIALTIFGYHVGKSVLSLRDQTKEAVFFLANLFQGTTTSRVKEVFEEEMITKSRTPRAKSTLAAIEEVEAHAIIWKNIQLSLRRHDSVSPLAHDNLRRSIAIYYRMQLKVMDEKGTHGLYKRYWNSAHRTFDVLRNYQECQYINSRPPPYLPAELYRSFLISAFNMKSTENAIRVWNFVVSGPALPSVEDWTTMIHGFVGLHDLSTVEKLWGMMLDSHVLPDSVALFVRIRALIKCGRSSQAIELMNDISKAWVSDYQQPRTSYDTERSSRCSDAEAHALPTSRTCNSALDAAIETSSELGLELLKWSDSLGIERDTFTFNLLLQMYLRNNNFDAFHNTFNDMIAQKVRPDAVTYGFLISLSSKDEALAVGERFNRVFDLLVEMKEAGLVAKANHLIPLLQKSIVEQQDSSMAIRLLKRVLEHLDTSVHANVITLLVQCVFQMPRPDLNVIDQILGEVRTSGVEPDMGFFNALAQGYAHVNDLQHMYKYLELLQSYGMQPTWKTLAVCLHACESNSSFQYGTQVLQHSIRATDRLLTQVRISPEQNIVQDHRSQFWNQAIRIGLV